MKKVTLEFDFWNHKELKDYLLSLKGVKKVDINDEKNLIIDIEYDPKNIGPKTLKLEVLAFMEIDYPSLVRFDLHEKGFNEYSILVKDMCCEYCYMNMIEELFSTNGIVAAESNYDVENYHYNINLEIKYDSSIITLDDIKQLEKEFNNE